MKFAYSFALILVNLCNIYATTPPEECSAVIDGFLAASCPGSGKTNCYNDPVLGDPSTDFTSRDLVYMGAEKTLDPSDGAYECCYTYESRAPVVTRDDCHEEDPPVHSIGQSHFTLGIDCEDFENQLTSVTGSKNKKQHSTCGEAVKVDSECNGAVGDPCVYTFCFKWTGMTAADQCCTSPGFYSIKNSKTDTFSCVTVPTSTCTAVARAHVGDEVDNENSFHKGEVNESDNGLMYRAFAILGAFTMLLSLVLIAVIFYCRRNYCRRNKIDVGNDIDIHDQNIIDNCHQSVIEMQKMRMSNR
eukprot:UN02342